MNNKLSFPKRVTVEVTNMCNLLCSFCPRNIVDMKIGNIDDKLYYKVIDELSLNLPVSLVLFFRGEPLLHPKIAEFICYAKLKGIQPIQLASNGYLLNDEISEKLIKSGLDFISFSLDTLNEEIYNKSRLHGDLSKSINNVINFIKRCENAKKQGIHVPEIQVSSVDVDEYKENQEEFIDFWRKYADRVRIYEEHSSDGHLGSIKDKLKNNIRKPCKKVFEEMVIYCNGDVSLCCFDWNNKMNLGNVKNKSIKEIWNSNDYENIRKMHINNSYVEELTCKYCNQWEMFYNKEGYIGKTYDKIVDNEE